jgi:polyisoprenoid-binding protein YceI
MRLSSLLAVLVLVVAAPFAAAADTYKLDPVHSFVLFRIKHMDVSYSYGRFNDPTGTIVYDAADPSKDSVELEIKVDNLDTHNDKRDQHLKSPAFFDAKQFPTITFKSTAVKAGEGGKLEVTGDLTLHGVTKSITVSLEKTGEGEVMRSHRVGFESTVELKKSDFEIKGIPGVGDDVTLRFSFEAAKQ